MDRRTVLGALGAAVVSVPALARPRPRAPAALAGSAMLAALERQSGGRLGVMVRDTASSRGFGWRANERFAQCSTFKLSLGALVLAEIDAGRAKGDEVLPYADIDVLPASPVTGARAKNSAGTMLAGKEGMTILALAQAAVEQSDNTAANLLLQHFGGPAGLTKYWRSLGDTVSRLDHGEPALNVVAAGEQHDTTTPDAMAATVTRLLAGHALSGASRARLWGWMKDCSTGTARLRAGLPAGWQAGDKTGTWAEKGSTAKINDIALVLAPAGDSDFRAPLVVTAYYEPAGTPESVRSADEAVLAAVMRIATDAKAWKAG